MYKQWKSWNLFLFWNIIRSEDFLFFDTKFYEGTKKYEGAKFFFYAGKLAMHERDFLIVTYTGFDKYGRPIARKMILKKFSTREEIEEEVSNKTFDSVISYELNKKRIIVEGVLPKNSLQFSPISPYTRILDKISKSYKVKYYYKDDVFCINLEIEKNISIIHLRPVRNGRVKKFGWNTSPHLLTNS